MNQGKLEAVKQEMTRIWKYLTWNSRILGISELKWTEMREFMTIMSTIVGKNPLEEMK